MKIIQTIFLSSAVLFDKVDLGASLNVCAFRMSRSLLVLPDTVSYCKSNDFCCYRRHFSRQLSLDSHKNVPRGNSHRPFNEHDFKVTIINGLEAFTILTPIWVVLVTTISINHANKVLSLAGGLNIIQLCLWTLMLSMGLSIAPDEISDALKKTHILLYNLALCFVMMPIISVITARVLRYNSSQTSGIVLLGCVSGGQASNLFTMIAGGDVALSIFCTLTSTLAGVFITPLLIKVMLGTVVPLNVLDVLLSVFSLVLVPVIIGLLFGVAAKRFVSRVRFLCPVIGVASTLILCAGGASKSAVLSSGYDSTSILASCILSIVGGLMAFMLTNIQPIKQKMNLKSQKALVIETLSKSPTLAYVLALKHFDGAASIPAAGMVTLAVIGALVGSGWAMLERNKKYVS